MPRNQPLSRWTVARAVCDGVIKDHLPFARTAKGGLARRTHEFPAFWESVLGALLLEAFRRVRENIYVLPLHRQVIPWAMRTGVKAVHRPDNFLEALWVRIE